MESRNAPQILKLGIKKSPCVLRDDAFFVQAYLLLGKCKHMCLLQRSYYHYYYRSFTAQMFHVGTQLQACLLFTDYYHPLLSNFLPKTPTIIIISSLENQSQRSRPNVEQVQLPYVVAPIFRLRHGNLGFSANVQNSKTKWKNRQETGIFHLYLTEEEGNAVFCMILALFSNGSLGQPIVENLRTQRSRQAYLL